MQKYYMLFLVVKFLIVSNNYTMEEDNKSFLGYNGQNLHEIISKMYKRFVKENSNLKISEVRYFKKSSFQKLSIKIGIKLNCWHDMFLLNVFGKTKEYLESGCYQEYPSYDVMECVCRLNFANKKLDQTYTIKTQTLCKSKFFPKLFFIYTKCEKETSGEEIKEIPEKEIKEIYYDNLKSKVIGGFFKVKILELKELELKDVLFKTK